jgi:hypothetical protein
MSAYLQEGHASRIEIDDRLQMFCLFSWSASSSLSALDLGVLEIRSHYLPAIIFQLHAIYSLCVVLSLALNYSKFCGPTPKLFQPDLHWYICVLIESYMTFWDVAK